MALLPPGYADNLLAGKRLLALCAGQYHGIVSHAFEPPMYRAVAGDFDSNFGPRR